MKTLELLCLCFTVLQFQFGLMSRQPLPPIHKEYILYQNGTPAGANTAFTNGQYLSPNPMYTDGSATAPLGNISFAKGARGIVIGAWPQSLTIANSSFTGNPDSWAKNFQGIVDEIR